MKISSGLFFEVKFLLIKKKLIFNFIFLIKINFMKFLKLNIILTICISNNLFSQAEVKFDTLQFDLGQIIEGGSNLKKNIYFTNIGNEPLIITQASTGDGGSMATWDREPILPGKKGKITFIYDTKRIGFFSKSIKT